MRLQGHQCTGQPAAYDPDVHRAKLAPLTWKPNPPHVQYHAFTFNPFLENTYIVWDESLECVLIDPGMFAPQEENMVREFIETNRLQPVRLLLTHSHLDHVFGNQWVHDTYGLSPELHAIEEDMLKSVPEYGRFFGVEAKASPPLGRYIEPGETISFGETELNVLFTPGHSPGHVVFHHQASQTVFSGDVLFRQSIGRTDLPGGDMATLLRSITEVLLPLGDEVTVLSGHGPATTIGQERRTNPFLTNPVPH